MPKRRVFNVVVDEQGKPIANAYVTIRLNTPTFVSEEQKELAGWGISVIADENGRWEAELETNDTMSDPNSFYNIVEYSRQGTFANKYTIQVPSTGFTEPIWIVNLLITPPQVTPPPNAVASIAADNNTPMQGNVRLLAGTGIQLQQDNNAKTITIVNTGGGGGGGSSPHNLLDGVVHPDTEATTVQRGMLIVGKLFGAVAKWVGLALGAAGKFLKSTGTDVVWGDVDWTEVQNKPSTFPPSAHTHNAADVAAGQFGTNTGGGDYSFPDKVGIGTTAPRSRLDVQGVSGVGTLERFLTLIRGDGVVVGGFGQNSSYSPQAAIFGPSSIMAAWDNVGFRFINAGVHFSTLSGSMGPITFQPHPANTAGAVRILPGQAGGKGLIIEGLSGQTANLLEIRTSGSTSGNLVTVQADGKVGVGTTAPTAQLQVVGSTGYNQLRLQTPYTPTSSGDPNGNVGDIAWDDRFVYVKTSEGWKRAPLSRLEILQQTSTSYTLQLTDTNNFVQINTTDPATVTIPADTTTNFPIGTRIIIQKYGTGDITIVGGSGVTVRDPNNQSVITVQFDTRVLIKIGANEWLII